MLTCPKCNSEMTEASASMQIRTEGMTSLKGPSDMKATICENCGYIEFWLKK